VWWYALYVWCSNVSLASAYALLEPGCGSFIHPHKGIACKEIHMVTHTHTHTHIHIYIYIYIKVKFSRYRLGVAQRVGRGIALLFHDCGTRRGWVVSSTPRPHFTPGKDPVPILQEAGWASGPVWTGGKSRPYRDSIPDRPARSQSLYRLSYPAHTHTHIYIYMYVCVCVWSNGILVVAFRLPRRPTSAK